MKRISVSIIAIILLLLCLVSCTPKPHPVRGTVHFSEMQYERPDLELLDAKLDKVKRDIESEDNEYRDKLSSLNSLNGVYWNFMLMSQLADLRFDSDRSNAEYIEEKRLLDGYYPIFAAKTEKVYVAAAKSKYKINFEKDYFGSGGLDPYENEDELRYKDGVTELYIKEAELKMDYMTLEYTKLPISAGEYSLSEASGLDPAAKAELEAAYSDKALEIFTELVKTRSSLASAYGYDSYGALMLDEMTDAFTKDELTEYLGDIKEHISPLYTKADKDIPAVNGKLSQSKLDKYCRKLSRTASEEFYDIYGFMKDYGLYDIKGSEGKPSGGRCTYILYYEAPYLTFNAEGKLCDIPALCREFGKFARDYKTYGRFGDAATDELVATAYMLVMLHGLEEIGLSEEDARALESHVICDTVKDLSLYGFMTELEQRLYASDALTEELIYSTVAELAGEYGISDIESSPSTVWQRLPELFSSPFYGVNFCVSVDGAMQIYSDAERATELLFRVLVDESQDLFAVLEKAELSLPFGRADELAELLEKAM